MDSMEVTTQQKRKRVVKLAEEDGNSRQSSFNKRKATLKNKARELVTLCDVMVCLVCYGPDGKVETWPEDKTLVHDMIKRYKVLRETPLMMNKVEERYDLLELLESKKKKLVGEKKAFVEKMFSYLETKIDQFSVEELGVFCKNLDSKLLKLRERIELLRIDEEEKQKVIRFNNNGECSYNQQEAVCAPPTIWPGVYGHFLMDTYVNNNDFGRPECQFPLCQNHQKNNSEIGNIHSTIMLPYNSVFPGFVHANRGIGAHENFSELGGGPYSNFNGGLVD